MASSPASAASSRLPIPFQASPSALDARPGLVDRVVAERVAPGREVEAVEATRPAASGTLRRGTLRFVDADLEGRYQREGGDEGLSGFRIISGTAAVAWAIAAVVVPIGTGMPVLLASPVAVAMAIVNAIVFVLADRARTLDRQHAVASLLTALNGLVILWLAATGGVLAGYGVSAVMLLFAFGFISRTAFIYAAWRSAVILVGFGVTAWMYPGPGHLLIDASLLVAAVIGSLVALRLLERSRRRVFYQDVVITQQADALRDEKERSDGLLRDVLPPRISARLLHGERTIADVYPSVSVLFADIVGFTALSARLRPDQLLELLDRLFTGFDALVAERDLEKIKTIGDAYMVAGGLADGRDDHARRTVDLGLRMIEVAARTGASVGGLPLRVGVHSGPVIGGVIGHRKFAFDIWGDTVNIASRLESSGAPNRVHVTEATRTLLGDAFDVEALGTVDLHGHRPIQTFAVR